MNSLLLLQAIAKSSRFNRFVEYFNNTYSKYIKFSDLLKDDYPINLTIEMLIRFLDKEDSYHIAYQTNVYIIYYQKDAKERGKFMMIEGKDTNLILASIIIKLFNMVTLGEINSNNPF